MTNWASVLGGVNQGFTEGQNAAHQMYMDKMQAYGAPYKAYGDAMDDLYRGYGAPVKYGQLRGQLDESMLEYRNKLYAQPLYQQNIRNAAQQAGVQGSAMYADPSRPLSYSPAQLQMAATYGLASNQMPTDYAQANGSAQQFYNNTGLAKNNQYNAVQYPMPVQGTTTSSGSQQAAAPSWSPMYTPPVQPAQTGATGASPLDNYTPYNRSVPGMMMAPGVGADPYAQMESQVSAAAQGARNPPIPSTASPYVQPSMTAAQNPYAAPADSPTSQNYYAAPPAKSKTTYKQVSPSKPFKAARFNASARGGQ